MNKSPIPSRNKNVIHESYCICPFCNVKQYYSDLQEDDYYYFLNTIIIDCPKCNQEYVPNSTRDITYIYSGHCKTKDKKLIKNIKNNS